VAKLTTCSGLLEFNTKTPPATAENRKKIGRKNLCHNRGGLHKLYTEIPAFLAHRKGII